MGREIHTVCGHCGHHERILLGIGMAYTALENIIDLVPKSMRNDLLSALARGPSSDPQFHHALYYCSSCDRRYGRFWFKVQSANETLEPSYRCRHCDTALRLAEVPEDLLEEELAKWRCNKCGTPGLQGFEPVLWD